MTKNSRTPSLDLVAKTELKSVLRLDEDIFGLCNCLIPSPSPIVNTTDSNSSNNTSNKGIPVTSSNINIIGKYKSSETLIQELKDKIKEDEIVTRCI
ncbi:hypothetical protein CU098_007257 [Rhizopus stolonifer]|uniref:Uncharacterized protein n=1 Tax=Rhizopus stolonifer TaxID=4846 RepID=A0A367KKU7_RHIST|nr:hypothetical protein CU098_007257 [Rhizopus stolonifer]